MRNYKIDNIRFILIFLVVFGHVLDMELNGITYGIYKIIYSFHMPVFIFITGYLANFKPKKILLSLVWPYLIMQIVVYFFRISILKQTEDPFSLITPEYTLWYLLATALYYLIIPIIKTESLKRKLLVISFSLILSLSAGYIDKLGYELTLARFFCFLPFFVAGYYFHNTDISNILKQFFEKNKKWIVFVSFIFIVVAEIVILKIPEFSDETLKSAFSYKFCGIEWYHRFFLICTAFAYIILLFNIVPNKKIRFVSTVGANTFSIYIVHGMIVDFLEEFKIIDFSFYKHLISVLIISIVLLLIFGNNYVAKSLNNALTGNWILKIYQRKEIKK